MIEPFISFPAISRQSPPSISINPKNIIPYQLNLYIRTDGLKFTRYWLIIVSLKLLILWLRKSKNNKNRARTSM